MNMYSLQIRAAWPLNLEAARMTPACLALSSNYITFPDLVLSDSLTSFDTGSAQLASWRSRWTSSGSPCQPTPNPHLWPPVPLLSLMYASCLRTWLPLLLMSKQINKIYIFNFRWICSFQEYPKGTCGMLGHHWTQKAQIEWGQNATVRQKIGNLCSKVHVWSKKHFFSNAKTIVA